MAKRKREDVKDGKPIHRCRYGTFIMTVCTLILAASLLFFCACSSSDEPAVEPVKKVQKKRPKKIKRSPKTEAPKSAKKIPSPEKKIYAYTANGIADPFIPLIADEKPKAKAAQIAKSSKPLTPLQKYELSQLKLVAIIHSDSANRAMLEDPTGFGYIVKEGMLVGNRNGQIKKISKNIITIEEETYSKTGDIVKAISTLTIQHQD